MNHRRAFIFDLDGTLLDTLADIASSLNAALADLDRPAATLEQVRSWIGAGLPSLCKTAWPSADEASIDRLIKRTAVHYERQCVQRTAPYHNILEMLKLLTAGGNVLAVLSNKPQPFVTRILASMGLSKFFVEMRGYVIEEEKKPSPVSALNIARQMRVSPAATFLIGDSVTDIQTARNAGMIAVAVTWGFQKKNALTAAKPDFLVDDPLEIPGLCL